MSETKYAVIGVGDFGSAVAKILSSRGAEVFAIDSNEALIDEIQDDVAFAVSMDATDKKALQSQNIQDFDAVVVAIGENFEALLLCCAQLQELGVKRIIARAQGRTQKQILKKIGIEEVLSPEYEFAELKAPKTIDGKTVKEVGLRDKYGLNLITIKREYSVERNGKREIEQHLLGVPASETVIYATDTIVVFGSEKDVKKFIEIN